MHGQHDSAKIQSWQSGPWRPVKLLTFQIRELESSAGQFFFFFFKKETSGYPPFHEQEAD